jgi:hypothetical protein
VSKGRGCSVTMLTSNFVQYTPYSKFQNKFLELNETYFLCSVGCNTHFDSPLFPEERLSHFRTACRLTMLLALVATSHTETQY